ncbi:MAG: hypothetical protein NT049_12780 [Planctomycetota bacterium]|nr:hypothetical protein [Planctomycetota bacterium]
MGNDNDNLQDEGPGRQADDRLVHALLLHTHNPEASEHREERVRRAMQGICESVSPNMSSSAARPAERTPRLRTWARRSVWAAAATVLIVVGLFALFNGPSSAQASLNEIIGALGRPGDRTYRIQMEDLPAPPPRESPDDPKPEMAPRPRLDNATLYLRDSQQYLLVRDDPKGGSTFDGYDGRQSWRVRAGVLAETKEGLGAGRIPMPPIMADVPFSDLHQTLERIRVDYTVEQFDQAPLPSGSEALRHVRVRRNSREVKGPETIEIWADLKTAMPKRIVFDRAKLQGNRQPIRLTFDLVSESPLSADWFAPEAHTADRTGDRRPPPR